MNISRISFTVLILAMALSITGINSNAAKLTTGSPAPDFDYTDVEGNSGKLSELEGKYVIIEWFNHGCPFVAKHYNTDKMQELQTKYTGKEVVWIAVNSTSDVHGDYKNIEETKGEAEKFGTTASHIVIDESGDIGKLYGAKTTPHIFIIDPEGVLIYQGAADSIKSTDNADIAKATNYIDVSMTEALTPVDISNPETKPYGCSVKY